MSFLKRNKKPIIITIHGFGRQVSHEFDPFAKYMKQKKYEVVQFDMYSPYNPNDDNPKVWISKAERVLNQYKDREIILLGFSMGGVIASYLATIYKVKRLILVAPAFQYVDLSIITSHVVKKITGKKEPTLSESQTKAFTTIINTYKDSISHVDCPVYIFQGTSDEIIPTDSSRYAYKQIPHNKKRLIFLQDAYHRMMYDGKMEKTIFVLLEQAIQDTLI